MRYVAWFRAEQKLEGPIATNHRVAFAVDRGERRRLDVEVRLAALFYGVEGERHQIVLERPLLCPSSEEAVVIAIDGEYVAM